MGTRSATGLDVAAAQGTPAEAFTVRAHGDALSSVGDRSAAGAQGSGRAVGDRALPISHGVHAPATASGAWTPVPAPPVGTGAPTLWAAGDVGNGIGVAPV